MKTDSNLTILVLSSDPYQPILKVWEKYIKKHWSDCPYKIVSVCNFSHFESDLINFVKTNVTIEPNASHFKHMMLKALDQIKTKYILYMCEDQILVKDVNTYNIDSAISYMNYNSITKIRCLSMPAPDSDLQFEKGVITNKDFGIISKDNKYRNSLQAAIWNKEHLIELLNVIPYEFSGWDFECNDILRNYSKKWNYISCKQGKGGNFLNRNENQYDSPLLQYVELVRWGVFDRIYIDFFRKMFAEDNFSVDTPEYEKFGAGKPKEWFPE